MLLLLLSVTRANADYTGPDRKVYSTSWQRNHCTYVAQLSGFSGTCTLHLYYYPFDSCLAADQTYGFFNNSVCGSSWGDCNAGTCSVAGPTVNLEGCDDGDEGCFNNPITTWLPEATISGVLDGCNASNGWCTGSPTLTLTSAEPLPEEQIIGLEGTYNGQMFAFAATTGSLNFDEGVADLSYWALSSYGDTSLKIDQTVRVDTQAPGIDASLSGTPGNNGWMISAATLTVNGVDPSPGSGIAAYQITVNGVTQSSNSISLIDGVHAFSAVAVDAAGWQSDPLTGEVKIDTQPPTVAVMMQAGERVDGWYTTPVSLIPTGTDGGSGIAGYQAALNNGAWVTFNAAFVVKNGEHTVAIRAVDVAGNASESWLSPVLRVNSTEALVYPELMFPHGSPVQGNNTAEVAAAAEVPLVAEAKAETTQPQVISFSNPPKQVGKSGVTASVKTSPGILWGALGASAIAGGAVMLAAAKRKEREEEQKKQQILAAQASAQRTGILLNRKAQQKAAARAAAAKAAEEAAQKAAIVSPDPKLEAEELAWLATKLDNDKKTKSTKTQTSSQAFIPNPELRIFPQFNAYTMSLAGVAGKDFEIILARQIFENYKDIFNVSTSQEFFQILLTNDPQYSKDYLFNYNFLANGTPFVRGMSINGVPALTIAPTDLLLYSFAGGNCTAIINEALKAAGLDLLMKYGRKEGYDPVIYQNAPLTVKALVEGEKWIQIPIQQNTFGTQDMQGCILSFANENDPNSTRHLAIVSEVSVNGDILYIDHSSAKFIEDLKTLELSEVENPVKNLYTEFPRLEETDQIVTMLCPAY